MKEQALLALQGPKAAKTLARLVPGGEQLGFMTGGAFTLDGAKAWISRSGYTGEDGFEISVPGSRVEAVADLLAEPEVKPIGLGARDLLRLEAGLPLYGHDLDPDDHAGRGRPGLRHLEAPAAEGGFAGWHRITRELEEGPVRRRVGLAGRRPPAGARGRDRRRRGRQ